MAKTIKRQPPSKKTNHKLSTHRVGSKSSTSRLNKSTSRIKNKQNIPSSYQSALTNILDTQHDLMTRYYDFWQNIFYNDTYIFYKHAIFLLKNQNNNKFHGFFSAFINKILWNGQCDYIISDNPDWINKDGLRRPEPSAFCKLGLEAIRSLDEMFNSVCPRLINHLTVYRDEHLPNDNKNTEFLVQSKPGDYIRFNNYLCTTINPNYSPSYFCGCNVSIEENDTLEQKKMKDTPDDCKLCSNESISILYIIELPPNTTGYYYNIPFSPMPYNAYVSKKDKDGVYLGYNEYEFVLPRGCIFQIISNKIDFTGARRIIHIKLIKQLLTYLSPKEDKPSRDLDKVFKNPKIEKQNRGSDNNNIELVDIFKPRTKLPNEYINCLELAKFHTAERYNIDTGFIDYMITFKDVRQFINSLLKVLPCASIDEIKHNRHPSLVPFYKSLHSPTRLSSDDKWYMCLTYFLPIAEILPQINSAKPNSQIKLPQTFDARTLVLTRNKDFAMLNSLLLYNFYKEDTDDIKATQNKDSGSDTKSTGKTKSIKHRNADLTSIRVSEVYTKLLYDYPMFFLIEITNISIKKQLHDKLYEVNKDISILSMLNSAEFKSEDNCKPVPNTKFNEKYVTKYKIIVNTTNEEHIGKYMFKHITADLVVQ